MRPSSNDDVALSIGSGLGIDSGPIDGIMTLDFTSWSAISLPSMLLCPGTQARVPELAEARRLRLPPVRMHTIEN